MALNGRKSNAGPTQAPYFRELEQIIADLRAGLDAANQNIINLQQRVK